jgi:hypothetical protein
MAKKNLINADMLLAMSPKRAEPIPTPVTEPTPSVKNEIVQAEPVIETPAMPIEIANPVSSQSVGAVLKDEIVEVKTPLAEPSIRSSVQKGLKEGETRATFIVQEDALEKIKAIAYWDRKNIKDVLQTALEMYISQYESKNGSIQLIP